MIPKRKVNQLFSMIYKETFVTKERMMDNTNSLICKIARYLFVNIMCTLNPEVEEIEEILGKSKQAIDKYIYNHDKFYNECEKYRDMYEKIVYNLQKRK